MSLDPKSELLSMIDRIKDAAFQRVDLMSQKDLKQASIHLLTAYNLIERRKGARRRG